MYPPNFNPRALAQLQTIAYQHPLLYNTVLNYLLQKTNQLCLIIGPLPVINDNCVRENDSEKLLVKSEEEYTSPVSKIYKVETEYIIVTENSIYVWFYTLLKIS